MAGASNAYGTIDESSEGSPGAGRSRRFATSCRSPRRPPGARVLDFGCADGKLLDALQDCGWETWGIESAVDTAFARHRRLDAIPKAPTFDLIVANHVFEHVTDPLGLLREFAGACRVGGYLHVGVPRFDTLPIHRDYKYVINGRAHVTAYTWPCLQGSARACRLEAGRASARSRVEGPGAADIGPASRAGAARRRASRADAVARQCGAHGDEPVSC